MKLRLATDTDAPAIERLLLDSVCCLSAGDYTPAHVAASAAN